MIKVKIIGITAATILALSPVITSATAKAADTETATNTTVNVNTENPIITFDGKSYDHTQTINDLIENASFNYLPINDSGDAVAELSTKINAMKAAFTATSLDKTSVEISFDLDGINYGVAGKYPVTVTATNKDGKSTSLTFMLTVGSKDSGAKYQIAYPQVRGNVEVFRIRDGKVISNSYGATIIANKTNVATFGTVTINGISYTRLNGPNSELFIETNSVNGVYPLTSTGRETKTLMHTAIIYDQDGHSKGKKYYAYRQLTVNKIKTNIKGSLYYNIYGTTDYIKVGNIDGTKRILKHNAYIYATSNRRANKTVLKKGDTIITYGSSYTFKNGKRYYRIEGATSTSKKYVKVANFE